jgi:hypothetical protein
MHYAAYNPCKGYVYIYHENGGIMFIRNIGILPNYTMSQPIIDAIQGLYKKYREKFRENRFISDIATMPQNSSKYIP